ncbi:hypothetical protein, partial [Legionella pneumophila]|uniref:hypothetical protein n=1 Tax=Legionella pneumophila TaxID=446 RepID=UPI001E4AFD5E
PLHLRSSGYILHKSDHPYLVLCRPLFNPFLANTMFRKNRHINLMSAVSKLKPSMLMVSPNPDKRLS